MIIIYLILVNIFAFIAFGVDKSRARRNAWRIPEKTLMILALLGGSAGALAGMYTFHHKTRKNKFKIGVPLILICQLAVYLYI